MKKLLAVVLTLLLALSLFAGCTRQVVVVISPDSAAAAPAPAPAPAAPVPAPAQGAVKTGLSVITSVGKSANATAEGDGLAQSDIALVAVTVGDDGVITGCVIDAVQAKINFSADGRIVTDLATEFQSKNERGTGYGMHAASSIGKEWNEQAAAMAEYAVGKTVAELRGMALNESGGPAEADLASSVTLAVGSFLDGIEAAVNNAAHLGAQAGDKLSLSAVTTMAKSKDASAEGNGQAQAYATLAAVTTSGDVITSCYIDAVQANVDFDTTGTIVTDLAAPIATKNGLGDAYGMKKASGIGKEWYEQAAAFSAYVTGKTLGEASGLAVTEDGGAGDADLAASVTVGIGDFLALIGKVTPSAGGVVKTGLSAITSVAKSANATAEGDGLAQSDIALVAVTVGDDGVITDCVIDAVQAKINFSADGKIVTDLNTEFRSKNELGTDYGMHAASSIGKEWNEQAAAMAEYAVGKTVAELKGMALNESGGTAEADLASSVTLAVGGFLDGIEAAVNSATHLGAQAGDKLSLTAVTTMDKSKDASAEGNGQAQAYATLAAITTNGGVITSCYIDAVQANVDFDTTGAIVTDLAAPIATKNELGDAYGMKKASGIGKEWYEQAAAFSAYVTGKTLGEASGLAVTEDGGAGDADLAASVTVGIGDFLALIAKAQ